MQFRHQRKDWPPEGGGREGGTLSWRGEKEAAEEAGTSRLGVVGDAWVPPRAPVCSMNWEAGHP